MPFKFFTVPIDDTGDAANDLNDFVARHRILSIDKRLIERETEAFWHFCVSFRESNAAASSDSSPQRKTTSAKPKVDYKEVLSAEDFAIYDRLRKRREDIAAEVRVPVYMVFNNQQLAFMVQKRITSKTGLAGLPGVSDGRVDKYGDKVLDILQQAWSAHEAERQSARIDP